MKIGTYILFSLKDRRTYVGSTNDLERRLLEHEKGKVSSTKNRLPVKLLYFEEFDNILDARKREHYFKSCSGRKKMKLLFSSFKSPASRRQAKRVEAGSSDTGEK